MVTPIINPIIRGDVEITALDPFTRVFWVVLHVKANPVDMGTAWMHEHFARRVDYAAKYLIDEGWIPDPKSPWSAMISTVCYPK
jgi:hypothetical protein